MTEKTKMRISFDLDEVLFVYPKTHKTEPPLRFPLNRIFKERLRRGAPELINHLQELGYEVWVYTSSFRTERYISTLFRLYGVHFDGIVNGNRHLREVQRGNGSTLPFAPWADSTDTGLISSMPTTTTGRKRSSHARTRSESWNLRMRNKWETYHAGRKKRKQQ